VRSRVKQLPPRLVLQRREGSKSVRDRLGPVLASTLRAECPLDVLQIDHTPAVIIVVDQQNRLPIGRPCLSLAIDVASRMVMGFHVSLDPPSVLAASLVVTHAVLPKAEWLADRELLTVEWPACGLPERVHVDNAKEFHSEAFARACQERARTFPTHSRCFPLPQLPQPVPRLVRRRQATEVLTSQPHII
jgi:putative transposase